MLGQATKATTVACSLRHLPGGAWECCCPGQKLAGVKGRSPSWRVCQAPGQGPQTCLLGSVCAEVG